MEHDAAERRLAAILSADVVGYSRLMAEDEAATLRTLTAYREEIGLLVRQHRGRVVDAPGDNLLAEFPTALDAVQGAVEIQRVIQARNADLPSDRRMEFRIGVHMGDVSVEGGKLYGDGVNIAARLEGLAKPGSVCISGAVYEQVERKLNVDLEDLGEQRLKNIARPVQVYGVKLVLPGAERGKAERSLPGMDELTVPGFGRRPAIAVLPFDNLSGDREQEYFADGIAEDLITRLSAWRSFPVIARNSSFVYKGRSVDVKRVSRELGVRYLVEGSVRKAGDRVRISAQLIDATTGGHLWAERYDREIQDIFALQDEITDSIVSSMHPELFKSERERALRKEPQDLDAWECSIRASWHHLRFTKADCAKARLLLDEAIRRDPQFGWNFSLLAWTHHSDVLYQWSDDPARSIAEMERAARRAVELDANDAFGQLALGALYRLTNRWEEAVRACETALRLNPSFAGASYQLGIALAMTGRPAEAIASLEGAMRLSPQDPEIGLYLTGMAIAETAAGRDGAAISWAERSRERKPDYPLTYLVLAGCYASLGRDGEARGAVAELLRLSPDFSLARLKLSMSGADAAFRERVIESLQKAGLKE